MSELPGTAVDVVVAGAGLAGHAAALAAAGEGLDVLLLEKQPRWGGSSVLAGGGLVFAGTALQRAEGVDDSPQRLRADLDAAGRGCGDPVVLDAYAEHQHAAYEWLCGLGATFTLTGGPVRRLHTMGPGALVALLHERVLADARIRYVPDAPVRRLLQEGDRVSGALVGAAEEAVSVRAGVVLASGGFARSRELVAELAPQCVGALAMGGAGSTGDGIRLGRACGAALADLEWVQVSFGASVLGDGPPRLLYAQSDGAIVVNRDGRRFANESADIKSLGRATVDQPGGLAFQIFDATVMAASRTSPSPRDFAGALADGRVVSAPTPAALAAALDLPPAALADTIRAAQRLSTPPFYGYPCRAGLTSTYGGLRVDGEMRVLTGPGAPIPGLYAAGEVVGGLHGAGYLVGSALGKAAVFGMVAGRAVAERAVPAGARSGR